MKWISLAREYLCYVYYIVISTPSLFFKIIF